MFVFSCITLVGCSHKHDYSENVITPTCTEDGFTEFICSCGDKFTEDVIKALGHSYSEWQVIEEATDEVEGRVIKQSYKSEVVTYKVIIKDGDKIETIELASIIEGLYLK